MKLKKLTAMECLFVKLCDNQSMVLLFKSLIVLLELISISCGSSTAEGVTLFFPAVSSVVFEPLGSFTAGSPAFIMFWTMSTFAGLSGCSV